MPAATTTQNPLNTTRSSASHYLVTPSHTGGWSLLEVLPDGEQDAAFIAGMIDVRTFRKFGDAAEMYQRLNAYYLPCSPTAVAAGQRVG